MRKKIVAGNWKMNKSLEEGMALASEVANIANDELMNGSQLIICVPFIHLASVAKLLAGSKVGVGAQNCSDQASGAFTGEISAAMIKSTGAGYVIIGHSERREYFKESDELLARKTDIVLANGLIPIFCIGETLTERESGVHFDIVKKQLDEGLFHLSAAEFGKVIVAYEPVWAIGTGKTATSAQAQEIHKVIRDHVASKYGAAVADDLTIQYGGSCKPDNAPELFACPDVDGGLIGGASLKARDFVDIAKSFKS